MRRATAVDTAFRAYQAEARGFVYFFLDRPESEDRALVKADQIALEMYWRAPNETKQRIVGLRDEKVLPTNIRYHLDHLTVVQDEYGDRIRLGDGDEVSEVVHPLAPLAERIYDYRLSDSLTVSFPGLDQEPVRVYEIQVRPRDPDRPGFVGSVFIDRATASIVRMSFTFTPASYVDPYLDYIRISLDNSLWMGKYWLPYRQSAELRRELPQLDFAAGSIIQGRFEIGGYEFNPDLPDVLFHTRGVVTVPREQREAFPFEEPLFARLEEEGLTTPPALDEIRERAREMVAERYLSGLGGMRVHLPSASSAYRFNRAEGHAVGAGLTVHPTPDMAVKTYAGWAFGRRRATGSITLAAPGPATRSVELYANRLQDIGPLPAASGVVNTLGGLLADEDWIDPYFATGARLSNRTATGVDVPLLGRWLGPATGDLELRLERHTSAGTATGDDFRPVRPVREGFLASGTLGASFGGGGEPSSGFGLRVSATAARMASDAWGTGRLSGGWARTDSWRDLDMAVRLDAGWTASLAGDALPPQGLFLLGGRGTLLGHPFRGFVGDRFWLARAEAGRRVLDPWLSLRAFGSAGEAAMDPAALPEGWADADPDAGVRYGVGFGVGLLWDVLRVDWGRGLDGGEWDVAFSVARRFHGWL